MGIWLTGVLVKLAYGDKRLARQTKFAVISGHLEQPPRQINWIHPTKKSNLTSTLVLYEATPLTRFLYDCQAFESGRFESLKLLSQAPVSGILEA
jgi:hypothetical protein